MPIDLEKPSELPEDPELHQHVISSAERAAHDMGLPHEAAEDICQIVMWNLSRIPKERTAEIVNLNAYVSRMVRNTALELCRKHKPAENIDSSSVVYSDQFAGAKRVELGILLSEIWPHLDAEERFILQSMIFGCDAKEIATRLKISPDSARQKAYRLRKRLRHLVFDTVE